MINQAAYLGVAVETQGIREAANDLDRFVRSSASAENNANQFTNAVQAAQQPQADLVRSLRNTAQAMGIYFDASGRARRANGQFVRSAELAGTELENLSTETRQAIAAQVRLENGLDDTAGSFRRGARHADQFTQSIDAATRWSKGLLAVIGGLPVAIGALVEHQSEAEGQLANWANTANVSRERFEGLAFAVSAIGISAEKLADISKDVNDKLGDFLATGGGQLKDFFVNVAPQIGLTAESLRGLAAPDVLIAVKNAMDATNTSAKDQVFYLETIANDASLLAPLLENNAELLRKNAQRGEELANSLSGLSSQSMIDAASASTEMKLALKGAVRQASALASPAFAWSFHQIAESLRMINTSIDPAERTKSKISELSDEYAKQQEKLMGLETELAGITDQYSEQQKVVGWMTRDHKRVAAGIEVARLEMKKLSAEIKTLSVVAMSESPISIKAKLEMVKGGDAGLGEFIVAQRKALNDQIDSHLVAQHIAALKIEAETYGMSAQALDLYNAKLENASEQQIDQINAFHELIQAKTKEAQFNQAAIEQQAERANSFAEMVERLKSDEQRLTEFKREQQALINEFTEEGSAKRLELQSQLNDELIRMEKSLNEKRVEESGTFWEKYLLSAEENLTSLDELTAATINNFSSGVGGAFEQMVFEAKSFDDVVSGLMENMGRSVVNALGKMSAEWLAYQAVQLLVGKKTQASAATTIAANAQAGVFASGINAFSSTAAIPIVGPPAAPAAMSAAIAATQPLAAAATKSAFAGMFDNGGMIGAGKFGIVGEYGPEIITGPVNVTSRRQTTEKVRTSAQPPQIKLEIINNTPAEVRTERSGINGENLRLIIDERIENERNRFRDEIRNGGDDRDILANTFGLNA